jgi:hypothetical protein
MELTNIFGLNFLPPVDFEAEQIKASVDHTKCKSGKCQQAFRPRCKCKCHGQGHQSKRRAEYGSIDDYLEGQHQPSTPLGVYL